MKLSKAGSIVLAQVIKNFIKDDHVRTEFVRALLPHLYQNNPKLDAAKFCRDCNVPDLL